MGLTNPSEVTPQYGSDVYVLVKEEAQYGVVPDNFYQNAVYLDTSGETIQQERTNLFSSGVRRTGHHHSRVRSAAAGIAVGGDFLTDIQYGGLELLMYGAFGGAAYQLIDVGSNTYDHYFYIVKDLPSFTIEIGKGKDAQTGYRHTGIMVNSLTLGVSADGFLTGTFGLIGKEIVQVNPTDSPQILYENLVSSTDLEHFQVLDISTKDISSMVGYAVSVDNKLTNDRRFLGSANIRKPQRSEKRKVSGRLVMEVGDEILLATNAFLTGSRHHFKINFSGNLITDSYYEELHIEQFKTELRGGIPSAVSPGRQHLDVPFDCYEWGNDVSIISDGELAVRFRNTRNPIDSAISLVGDGFDDL